MSKLRKWMMKEERDTNSTGSADLSSSAIKLFGKTIAVADSASTKAASEEEVEQLEGENLKEGEVVNGEDVTVSKTVESSTTQEEKKEQCSLKKPDKLIPCPRCESVDTKFCYYNNYNINQPRHFCKSCQRYWTAGGTLRNVLVGAGRRKNKYGVQGAQGKEDGESQHSIVRVDHHEPAQQPMATVYGTVPPMSLPRHSETSTVTSMGCPSAFKPLGPEVSSDSVTKLRQRTSDVTNKSSDCATSCSGETTTTTQTAATVTPATYVLTPRAAPEQAAVWTKPAATPLGFFNGAWPYGYNIGWTSGTQGGPPSAATAALCVPHSGNWAGMCVPTFGWNMLQGGWTLPWRPVPAVGVQMQGPGMTSNRKRDAGSDGDARAGKIARVGASAGDEPVAAV